MYVRGPDDRVCDSENMMVLSSDIGIPGLPVYTLLWFHLILRFPHVYLPGKQGARARPPSRGESFRERVWRDEEEREIHENAANLPLRECFAPKRFSGAALLEPA